MGRLLPVLLILSAARAADIKPVPPLGVLVPKADRAELEAGLARLGRGIEKIRENPLAPDVQIFHNAVRYALQYDEFFKSEEIFRAKELLRQGQERADALAGGSAPWTASTGLAARVHASK